MGRNCSNKLSGKYVYIEDNIGVNDAPKFPEKKKSSNFIKSESKRQSIVITNSVSSQDGYTLEPAAVLSEPLMSRSH